MSARVFRLGPALEWFIADALAPDPKPLQIQDLVYFDTNLGLKCYLVSEVSLYHNSDGWPLFWVTLMALPAKRP